MDIEHTSFQFGKTKICLRIQRTRRRKTIGIVVTADGTVVVRAPHRFPVAKVEFFARRKGAWIIQKMRDQEHQVPTARKIEFVNGESFSYLGRHYLLKIRISPHCRLPYCKMRGRFLVCTVPPKRATSERQNTLRSALKSWFCIQAENRVLERIMIYRTKLGVRIANVMIRDQQKRWASCDRDANLRFNWRIMMAPISLVDCVVAHELCHLKLRNHSSRFWKTLRTAMPDYESRKHRLSREGYLYNF